MPRGQDGQGARRVFGGNDGDHADTHVERLLHLCAPDPAALGNHGEYRRGCPGAAVDLGDEAMRDDPLQVAGEPAAGDVAKRPDTGFGGQGQTVFGVDASRLNNSSPKVRPNSST